MQRGALLLLVLVLGPVAAVAQEPPGAAAVVRRQLRLSLDPLFAPGYEPARELRLGLFDSSMSRLELFAAREQWSVRHSGPIGAVAPLAGAFYPFSLQFGTNPYRRLVFPGTRQWSELSWEDKLAAGAQLGALAWIFFKGVQHAR